MRRVTLLLPLVLAASSAPAHASTRSNRAISVPDLTAGERAVIEDARDDKLDRFDPVTAAIATSRASAEVKERASARWREFLESMAPEAKSRAPAARAEWLLATLHVQLLTGGYSFFQNDVALLLEDGTFNCVSSSIVYQAAAEKFGIDVRGVLVPSHVYERVRIDGVDYDIETTSPRGFLLDRDDAGYAQFLVTMRLDMEKRYGRKIQSEKFYRREIDSIDLIAMLYANLGAEAVEQGKQPLAIAQFARAVLLAKDERYARDSRDILLGQMAETHILKSEFEEARRLFAFAIKDPGSDATIEKRFKENIGYCFALEAKQKVDRKDYEGALASYSAGSKWSSDPAFEIDEVATYNQWGLEELASKEFARSAAVFLRARNEFPKNAAFAQNLKAAYFEWSQAQIAARDYDGGLATARALRAKLPEDADTKRVFAFSAAKVAEAKSDANEWDAATALMEEALAACPELPGLRANVAAVWTNAGVAWLRAGDGAKASAAWKHALDTDPAASAARTNLDRVTKKAR